MTPQVLSSIRSSRLGLEIVRGSITTIIYSTLQNYSRNAIGLTLMSTNRRRRWESINR